jgi:hypothetical protein
MTSKRVHADWGWDMLAEVGLFLIGAGTSLILVALIWLRAVSRDQPQEAVVQDHPLPPTVPGTSSLNDPD